MKDLEFSFSDYAYLCLLGAALVLILLVVAVVKLLKGANPKSRGLEDFVEREKERERKGFGVKLKK